MNKQNKTLTDVYDAVYYSTSILFVAIVVFLIIILVTFFELQGNIRENTIQTLKLERAVLELRSKYLDSNVIILNPKQQMYPRLLIKEVAWVQ